MEIGIITVRYVEHLFIRKGNKNMILRPPIKIHGGKWYLKKWVIEHFPENYQDLRYLEPCCGGASVFINKERSQEEIINDVDEGVVNIFKALRDEPKEFIDRLKKIKYTEKSFSNAQIINESLDYIDLAVNEYVLRRMSRGGMKKAFAWSDRERGGQPGDVNAWKTMLKQLPEIAERLVGTTILNKKFQDIVKIFDESDTFFYIDPPYLPITRTKGSTDIYDNEMSVEDHVILLTFARDSRSKILLSGYYSSLYSKYLKGWHCSKKEIANHSSQAKVKERRYECLWWNY